MHVLLARLATWVGRHRKAVLIAWGAIIVASGYFALHQQDYLQGGGWEVSGSQAKRANELLKGFNGYSVAGLAVVVSAPTRGTEQTTIDGNRYRASICCAPANSLIAAFGSSPADVAAKISRDAESEQALAFDVALAQPPADASPAFALGKSLSNLCADIIQLQTPKEIAAAAATVPPVWRPLTLSPETTPPLTAASCKVWGVPSAPAAQRAPVKSSIPAIVLADEWDHVIYPEEGRSIVSDLGNAKLYAFPGLDHIALLNFLGRDISCPRQIATSFVDSPSTFPSAACTASMEEPRLAGTHVPFKAVYAGKAVATGSATQILRGKGFATLLGQSTNEAHVVVIGPDESCEGGLSVVSDVTLTGADGDELHLTGADVACPTGNGGAHELGRFVVTGGTGRFTGASGRGKLEGRGDFKRRTFHFELDGTISARS